MNKKINAMLIVSILIIVANLPQFSGHLQLQLENVKMWQLITAHFTHWSFDHFFWDFSGFLLLSILLIKHNIRLWFQSLLLAPLGISLVLIAIPLEVSSYRGLSGVDFTLFTLVTCLLISNPKYPRGKVVGSLLLIGSVFKILYEFSSNQAILCQGDRFVVMAESHLVGLIIGLLIWYFNKKMFNDAMYSKKTSSQKGSNRCFLMPKCLWTPLKCKCEV